MQFPWLLTSTGRFDEPQGLLGGWSVSVVQAGFCTTVAMGL